MGLWSLSPMGMGPPLGRLGLASPLVTGPQWSSGSRSTDGAGLMLVEPALANDVGLSPASVFDVATTASPAGSDLGRECAPGEPSSRYAA
jgi:hypothetical protein